MPWMWRLSLPEARELADPKPSAKNTPPRESGGGNWKIICPPAPKEERKTRAEEAPEAPQTKRKDYM